MDVRLAQRFLHTLVIAQCLVESEVEQILDALHPRVQARRRYPQAGRRRPDGQRADRQRAESASVQQTDRLAGDDLDGDIRVGFDRGDLAVLAIARPDTDEFAGSLVLFDISGDRGEVGFRVHPDHRGGGTGSAALDLSTQFARRSGLARLTARTATDNAASRRVLTRAGFAETGRVMGTAPSGHALALIHYERTT
nr:GNAT family N-acetyltransferase [Tomitella gaofuii]